MTFLEQYLKEHNLTEKDFWISQEDYDGFCPPDVGVINDCNFNGTCKDCWKREISII